MMAQCRISYCFALFLIINHYTAAHSPHNPPPHTANISTTWHISDFRNDSSTIRVDFTDGASVQPIIVQSSFKPAFACGFYCNGNCTSYLFGVYIIPESPYDHEIEPENGVVLMDESGSPQVVWSANRDYPVSFSAALNFTATGSLVLQDVDGSTVWTTDTMGKSVVGMNLTDTGNLVLFDVNSSVVWQSFDHPTDSLVLGQTLYQGQQLIPGVSSTNWTAQNGLFSLQVTHEGLVAYLGSNPRQVYFRFTLSSTNNERKYFRYLNGSLAFFPTTVDPSYHIGIPETSSTQYMKFMPNGHLKVFEWKGESTGWFEMADLLTSKYYGECSYPYACGRNAICSSKQQCTCPVSNSPGIDYFRAVDLLHPNLGCNEVTPLTCNTTQDHVLFIPLKNVSLYTFSLPDRENVSMETCKQACLNNCSCKAAVIVYSGPTYGQCYLPSELSSMIYVDGDVLTFIKVQNAKSTPPSLSHIAKKKSLRVVLVITAVIGSSLVVGFTSYLIHKLRSNAQMEDEYIDVVPGLPTRFTYEELRTATENFSKKLGQGGFGSVFEGTLEDDLKIAVKRLDGLGQVNKSFLAEVKSIGNIHHVNLVKLKGFCAWKSQRFLVYDFMSKGSLDKWIYHGVREKILEWECRKKIILDIAKGLAYLHEDCMQKIIHLDIKPQNILLDNDFNAKVSDFGLSKLIDKDESQVMTTMRGTPGYMAPEWLSSVITEKVDVYSFGVVLLEILCGRKKFDRSQSEESWHLLSVFQKCWEQGKLLDIVDKYSEDMQTHGQEVVEMMKVASWCLQTNFTRRPSMAVVVKVLEGVMNVDSNLDYNFTDPRLQNTVVEHEKEITRLLASALSGPR